MEPKAALLEPQAVVWRPRSADHLGAPEIIETGDYPDRACAICGTQPCVAFLRRAITPEDALDALHKVGVACWYDESYFCAGHAAAVVGLGAAPLAA
ncbi:MAG TPA: hypothetical protein VFN74_18930 [Chloroflexota bacterium]|nr:hypothetical protein [Chloroflexota bacterium]